MRLNHVTLASADPERALPFYEGLGLTTIVVDRDGEGRLRYARLIFPDGDSTLSIERGPTAVAAGTPAVVVFFECQDLDERVLALRAAGYVFDSGPETKPWLWREARLRDPDGHPLCLFRAGIYRVNPPWRIAPAAPRIAGVPSAADLASGTTGADGDAGADVAAGLSDAFLGENNRGYVDVPIPSARDQELGAYLGELARGGPAAAAGAARLVGPAYTATFVAYAERMASLAVRLASVAPARLGVLAIGLCWSRAADVRTAIPVLGVLFDGIRRAGGDPREIFREVAELGPPDAAPVLRDFLGRVDLDEIAEEMGFSARQDRDGFRYRRNWGAGRLDDPDAAT